MAVTRCWRALTTYFLVIACAVLPLNSALRRAQGGLRRAALGPAPDPAVYFTPGQDVWATTTPPEIPPLRPPPGPEIFEVPELKAGWQILPPDAGKPGQEVELYGLPSEELNGQTAVLIKRVEVTDQWIIRLHGGYTRALKSEYMIVPIIEQPKAVDASETDVLARYGSQIMTVGTTMNPGTSGDDLSDPLNAVIGDVVFPSPKRPKPVEPTLVYDNVPGSPPVDTGVPLTDPINDATATAVAYAHDAVGSANDFWNDASDTVDWMKQFNAVKVKGKVDVVGNSCEESCMKCSLAALGQKWANMCPCFTTCQRGPQDAICTYQERTGWSNEHVSRPHERWRSQCTTRNAVGQWQNCASCLPLKFQAAVQRCKSQHDVAACAAKVRQLLVPESTGPLVDPDPLGSSANFAGANYFCRKPHMESCEGFAVLPANGQGSFALDPKDSEWRCFGSARECKQNIKESIVDGMDVPWKFRKNTTVVWDAVGPYNVGR